MLLMPSPVNPFIAHFATKAAPTAPTTFVAKLTVKVNTDSENTVPSPYSSHLLNNDFVAWNSRHRMNRGPNHLLNNDFVAWNSRHRMNRGPNPTTSAMASLLSSNIEPATTPGPAMPRPVNHRARSFSSLLSSSPPVLI